MSDPTLPLSDTETLPPIDETLTMDDLYKEAVDNKQADEAAATLLDEAGTYISQPPMTITPFTSKDGRKGFRVFGIGVKGDKKGRLNISLSWEHRENPKKPGEPDWMYKMYLECRRAFKHAIGEFPVNVGQLAEYLRDYPAKYRLIQVGVPTKSNPDPEGEPGTLVTGVYGIKAQK